MDDYEYKITLTSTGGVDRYFYVHSEKHHDDFLAEFAEEVVDATNDDSYIFITEKDGTDNFYDTEHLLAFSVKNITDS